MSVKVKAAEALYPLLSIFHELDGLALRKVRHGSIEGSFCILEFHFDTKVLVIQTNDEDDAVEMECVKADTHRSSGKNLAGDG
ncbi:MAG TPA: hypothetical protein VGI16_04630 [Candidatus Acidoferrum sp.]|jgi:hypothetical protein